MTWANIQVKIRILVRLKIRVNLEEPVQMCVLFASYYRPTNTAEFVFFTVHSRLSPSHIMSLLFPQNRYIYGEC